MLNEGCNKDQVIWPVPQRKVHARDSTKTRLYGLFHREGSMLKTSYQAVSTEKGPWSVPQRRVGAEGCKKTRLPGLFHREGLVLKPVKRPGYLVCSTENGWC